MNESEAVTAYSYLLRQEARRWVRPTVALEDLSQVGAIGLVKAVRAFDPTRGVPFEAFARQKVGGEIAHYVRDREHLVRKPRMVPDAPVMLPLDEIHGRVAHTRDVALAVTIEAALDALYPVERRVMLAFAAGCDTTGEIAVDLRISRTSVNRHLAAARTALRERLADSA